MSIRPDQIAAVIPAAGFSSRMHAYKPLLPLGMHTILEQTISLFQSCGIEHIMVVTGHNRDRIEPVIRKTGATPIFNPGYADGMLSSIKTGTANVPADAKGFFLLPVDIAAVRPATVRDLLAAFTRAPRHIIFPEFQGETGHPPLIPSGLIPEILALGPDHTLRDLLLSPATPQERLTVHDRGILMDADTQKDYVALQKKFNFQAIPDRRECESIIDTVLPGEDPIRSHLELVTETALALNQAILQNCNYAQLNRRLIRAAALLHDIKRKEEDHAARAGEYIKNLGFPNVADIVSQHMDLHDLPEHLTEAQVVYFADKICNGTRIHLDYDLRFTQKMAAAPQARNRIMRRHEHTRHIQTRIEEICRRPVRDILH